MYEGTSKLHMSRLHLLITKFENMRMNEEESICEFHIRLHVITYTSFSLGENMSEVKMEIKILRSLSKRFEMKEISIENS